MGTTPTRGLPYPEPTDLVTNGAAAMQALAEAVDDDLAALDGGTVKTAVFDAKGDLLVATAGDTPARLAVGADGYQLVADSTAPEGVRWGEPPSGALVVETFTASATWNRPPGAKRVEAVLVGAGGGGGAGNSDATYDQGGSGGQPGSVVYAIFEPGKLGLTEPVVVGAGGPGAVGDNANPTDGGASTFGGVSSADTAYVSGSGRTLYGHTTGHGRALGPFVPGGGGQGESNYYNQPASPGGVSRYEGDGGAGGSIYANGQPGQAPGGGGGGGGSGMSSGGYPGGDGAPGEVRIYSYF